jgi:hypothetical protein
MISKLFKSFKKSTAEKDVEIVVGISDISRGSKID